MSGENDIWDIAYPPPKTPEDVRFHWRALAAAFEASDLPRFFAAMLLQPEDGGYTIPIDTLYGTSGSLHVSAEERTIRLVFREHDRESMAPVVMDRRLDLVQDLSESGEACAWRLHVNDPERIGGYLLDANEIDAFLLSLYLEEQGFTRREGSTLDLGERAEDEDASPSVSS